MNVIFLDTETSGGDSETHAITQLAFKKSNGEIFNSYFNPGHPTTFEAMAVTNITDEMLKNAPILVDHPVKESLGEDLKENYLVAHNAAFDIKFLMREGIFPRKHICTLKVSRRYATEDIRGQELSGHSIQYLRYALGINDDSFTAHDALSDILLLEKLFNYQYDLLKKILGTEDESQILEHMYEVSQQPSLLRRIKFGKHKDMTYEQLAQQHPDYLEWLLSKDDVDEDVRFTADYYLKIYYRK